MTNPNMFEKLDIALGLALRAWQAAGDARDPEAGVSISLRYEGDLASIEAIGFETQMVRGDSALGVVRFEDIPALVANPRVLWMATGRRPRLDLDTAVSDIRARASAPITGPPIDGLWHAVVATGALTNALNATGDDVIVAVIDTGIDYRHPMFMSQLTPPKTRILRIWDQGLVPATIAECPLSVRVGSGLRYGVEYDDHAIDADLNGGPPFAIRHKDCDGHGTHVAGIAAGGTVFGPGGDASKVGVAPKAFIIAVKLLDTPESIFPALDAGGFSSTSVPWTTRFEDAVLYCLRTAHALGKPIVINMSFGDSGEAGDGLDDGARFIDGLMDPTAPAGPFHFPTRAIIVKSAGNYADQMSRIVVPASGHITVPLRLRDTRGTLQTSWEECTTRLFKPRISVHFWYRPEPLIHFEMRVPNGAFGPIVAVGTNREIGFTPLVGPPPSAPTVAATSAVHRATLWSETPPTVPHPDGAGSVHRHHLRFFVQPKETGGTISYHPGIYEVRITAPAGTVFFVMCGRQGWSAGKLVLFEIAPTMQNGDPLHANISITTESSAPDPFGRHVITVAAYDDENGGDIVSFSSRGPLRDFSDPAHPLPVIAAKPDIAAPGMHITSAEGIDTEPPPPPAVRLDPFFKGLRFDSKSGTSMAAPMVTGLIALMLDKKNDLNVTQARAVLFAAPRTAVNPSTGAAATNAYGRGRVDAMTSHSLTP